MRSGSDPLASAGRAPVSFTILSEATRHGESTLSRFRNVEAEDRKMAAAMLFAGAMFGLVGFMLAALLGVYMYLHSQEHQTTTLFASVAEMVHDPHTTVGKCFFAFEFIGAMLVFFSWYPFKLRRVFSGDDEAVFMIGISWPMFRQFVPTLGWMLFATVTIAPVSKAFVSHAVHGQHRQHSVHERAEEVISFGYHAIPMLVNRASLLMFFGGYAIAEAKVLGAWVFEPPGAMTSMKGNERWWRRFWLSWLALAFVVELVLQGFLTQPKARLDDMGFCCKEVWIAVDRQWTLKEEAQSRYLLLKMIHFGSELVMGLSLICSLLGLWYFCDERHADLDESLGEMRPSLLDSRARDTAAGIELQSRLSYQDNFQSTSMLSAT